MSLSKIKRSDLTFEDEIGRGGYSTVYRAKWQQTRSERIYVAAKKTNSPEWLELEVMSELEHENIVKLLGVVDEKPDFFIILELCHGGSLRNYLTSHGGKGKRLPEGQFLNWAEQAAKPLEYLRKQGIIHRDVKSDNYVIAANKILKLTDFGLAKKIKETIENPTQRGTLGYMAPELLKDFILSPSFDVFSYGTVLWELFTTEKPFKDDEWFAIVYKVCHEHEHPPIPDDCPQKIADLMRQCWQEDWRLRPSIEDVLTVIKVDPLQSTIQLGQPARSRYMKEALVQTVDFNGEKMNIGNVDVEATQGVDTLCVQDNKNGTYTINYTSKNTSEPLHVKINTTAMKGSPFNTRPEADPKQCTIDLGQPSRSRYEMKAVVQTVDCNSDHMIIGNAKVEATQGGNALNVQDNKDGTYTIDYTSINTSAPLHVKINGTEMKGGPFNTKPEADPKQCTFVFGQPGRDRYKKKAVVQTVDCNSDQMIIGITKVEATQGGNALDVQDNKDGTYTIDYTSKNTSEPLHVKINGTEMKGSPFNTKPEVDQKQCTIDLGQPGISQYMKKVIVQTVDLNGDQLTIGNAEVEATQDGNALDVQDNKDGTYTIDYTSKNTSEPLHVKINGTEMKGSPFNTKPEAGPKQCTIDFGQPGSSRYKKQAVVQTVDCNSDKMVIGITKVEATQGGNALDVQNNRDGTYTVDYTSKNTSEPLHVKINGTEMKGSSFNTKPEPDPKQCTIDLGQPGSSRYKKQAVVQTVDCNSDKMVIGIAKFEATQGGTALDVLDNKDGTYTIDYTSKNTSAPLHLKINGTEMKGSPFNTRTEVDPMQSTIQLGHWQTSGSWYGEKAIVQMVDCYGDKLTIGNVEVKATQGVNTLDVRDKNNGTYMFRYTSEKTSEPLHVKINGIEMKESPFGTQPKVNPMLCTIKLGMDIQYRREASFFKEATWAKYENVKKAIVQTVDVHYQRTFIGSTKVEATQGGDELPVLDGNDGTYTFDYTSTKTSEPLHVKINGIHMRGSPFNTKPEVDPMQCTIALRKKGISQYMKKAIVQTVDCNSKKTFIGSTNVEATQGGDKLSVLDRYDGTYTIDYTAMKTSHILHVKINRTEMKGSPFKTRTGDSKEALVV